MQREPELPAPIPLTPDQQAAAEAESLAARIERDRDLLWPPPEAKPAKPENEEPEA